MTFLEFKDKMFDLACFNIYQINAWQPDFDRNNLTRWIKKGYLIRLRKQATEELLKTVDLKKKQKDFEHLLFNKTSSEKILRFGDFVNSIKD
jgi:hypothetical protein